MYKRQSQNIRILVIEEEKNIQNLITSVLNSQHYQVISSLTGRDGLSQAASAPPDLIPVSYTHLESAGQLLCRILHDNMKKIYLGHMSKENNYAQLAYETVKLEIQLDPVEYMPQDFDIQVAERDCISGICNF